MSKSIAIAFLVLMMNWAYSQQLPFINATENDSTSVYFDVQMSEVHEFYITPRIAESRWNKNTLMKIDNELCRALCEDRLYGCLPGQNNFYIYANIQLSDSIKAMFVLGQAHYGAMRRVYLCITSGSGELIQKEVLCDIFGDVGSYKLVQSKVFEYGDKWYIRRYWRDWVDESIDDVLNDAEYEITKDELTIFELTETSIERINK